MHHQYFILYTIYYADLISSHVFHNLIPSCALRVFLNNGFCRYFLSSNTKLLIDEFLYTKIFLSDKVQKRFPGATSRAIKATMAQKCKYLRRATKGSAAKTLRDKTGKKWHLMNYQCTIVFSKVYFCWSGMLDVNFKVECIEFYPVEVIFQTWIHWICQFV